MKKKLSPALSFLIVLATMAIVVGYPVLHFKYGFGETILHTLASL